MGLNIVKHAYGRTDGDILVEKDCGQKEGLDYDIISPVFSLNQLYFIFNYGNSASADGGPRSRVCARETLRSAPHRH